MKHKEHHPHKEKEHPHETEAPDGPHENEPGKVRAYSGGPYLNADEEKEYRRIMGWPEK